MYVIIWEFEAKHGREAEFENVYGPAGLWAQFFETGEGYLDTQLLRDNSNPQRYLTIDRWLSAALYDAFRADRLNEYQAIDGRCEALTEWELLLGTFLSVS